MRILLSGSHVMLVGVGGSGRKSLAKLSAFLLRYALVELSLSQSRSFLDFKTDLQNLFARAGLKGEKCLFLVHDTHFKHNDRMLVYISDLLSSGFVPDMYSRDEKEALLNQLSNRLKAVGPIPVSIMCPSIHAHIRNRLSDRAKTQHGPNLPPKCDKIFVAFFAFHPPRQHSESGHANFPLSFIGPLSTGSIHGQ